MKVLYLYDVPEPTDPEQRVTGASFLREDRSADASVFKCLRRLGHEVETFPVYDDVVGIVRKIQGFSPDVVFNGTESFRNDRQQEPNVCGLLELLGVRYTGAGPESLMLCKDKALAKKLLTYHHIRVPHFKISRRRHPIRRLKQFPYPVFIKPSGQDASEGVSVKSMANTEAEALERVRYLHRELGCDVMIEEYIDGRELYLSIMGNAKLTVWPYRELFFGKLPDDGPRFASDKVKWDPDYRVKWNIANGPAGEMSPELDAQLYDVATRVYRILKIRGFGRLDVRLTADNRIFVLEANPNPSLDENEDFAQAAYEGGMDFEDLVQAILDLA